jgi:hypothetical protein
VTESIYLSEWANDFRRVKSCLVELGRTNRVPINIRSSSLASGL